MDSSSYGTSALGALTIAIVAAIAWCVRNKFKHSNCELNSGCLKVSSHEDDETRNTIRREIIDQLRLEGIIPPGTADVECPVLAISDAETHL